MISRRHFIKIGGFTIPVFGFVGRVFGQPKPSVQTELQNMVSGVKPLAPEDYAARLEKAQRLMAENNLDGLFLEPGPSLQYFTNIGWGRSERTFGPVITKKGLPVWVCSRFELERAREFIPADQEVRTWEEDESPFKLMSAIMKDYAGGSRLGLEPTTRSFIYYGLHRDAPVLELADGAVVTEGCRGIKSDKEIAYMDLANRITKLAYKEGFKSLREGMSGRDLSGAIGTAHQKMGVSGGGWPQFGPNSAFPHGSRAARSLQPGDVVMVDGGCGVEGYRSDVTRTVVFGKPSDKQRRAWDVVKKAQEAAFKAVRPGIACEDIDRAARKEVEKAGFGPGYKYFSHRLGHGIGLEGHEYPYLVPGNKLKLQPGMTFSNEPGIYIFGEFGIRIEDCFAVTEKGAHVLGGMKAVVIDRPFGE